MERRRVALSLRRRPPGTRRRLRAAARPLSHAERVEAALARGDWLFWSRRRALSGRRQSLRGRTHRRWQVLLGPGRGCSMATVSRSPGDAPALVAPRAPEATPDAARGALLGQAGGVLGQSARDGSSPASRHECQTPWHRNCSMEMQTRAALSRGRFSPSGAVACGTKQSNGSGQHE